MVAIVALIVWRLNPLIVIPVWLIFAALDGVYLSSALTKVPDGAWFTLVLACVLSSIFILWRFGKEQQWHAEAEDRISPARLVAKNDDGQLQLRLAYGGGEVTNIKGFGIFFDKIGDMTPTVFIQFLSKFVATPDVMVFFHLRPLSTPSIPPEKRYTVTRIGAIPNCYRLVIRHGYTDEVISEDLSLLVYEQIRNFIIRDSAQRLTITATGDGEKSGKKESDTEKTVASSETSIPTDSTATTPSLHPAATQLRGLEAAYMKQVLYIVGKEQMRIKAETRLWRRVALSAFLWLRDNTRSKLAGMKIPTDQLVEVGFIKEV